MNPTVKEQLQKYIAIIEKGLADPEPDFISLQIAIDNFIGALPLKLRSGWLKEQEKITSFPKHISNNIDEGSYGRVFKDFLTNHIKPEIAALKEEELVNESLDPEQLQILVEDLARHDQEISAAQESWRGKWREVFRKQVNEARKKALYHLDQHPEILTGNINRNQVIADLAIGGAVFLKQHPAGASLAEPEKHQAAQEKIDEFVTRGEKRTRFWLGLPPQASKAMVHTMMLLSGEKNLFSDSVTETAQVRQKTSDYLDQHPEMPADVLDKALVSDVAVEGAKFLSQMPVNQSLSEEEKEQAAQKQITDLFAAVKTPERAKLWQELSPEARRDMTTVMLFLSKQENINQAALTILEAKKPAPDQLSFIRQIRQKALGSMINYPEIPISTPVFNKAQMADLVIEGAAILNSSPRINEALPTVKRQETAQKQVIDTLVTRGEKQTRFWLGLPPEASKALVNIMLLMSDEEKDIPQTVLKAIQKENLTRDASINMSLAHVAVDGAKILRRSESLSDAEKGELIKRLLAEEKTQNILYALSPNASEALVRTMRYLSKEGAPVLGGLPDNTTEESLQKQAVELARISVAVEKDLQHKQLPFLNSLSRPEKDRVVMVLSDYFLEYNGLLKRYRLDATAIEEQIKSHPQLANEIKILQDKYRTKLRDLGISNLSPENYALLLEKPHLYIAGIKSKIEVPSGLAKAPLTAATDRVSKDISLRIKNIAAGAFSRVQIIISNVIINTWTGVGAFFKTSGNALASGFTGVFNWTATQLLDTVKSWIGKSAVRGAGKAVVVAAASLSPETTLALVIIGLVLLVSGVGFSFLTFGVVNMSDTAAFINNPTPPPETEIELLTGEDSNINNPGGPIVGSCGSIPASVDTSGFPRSSLAEVNSNCPVTRPPLGSISQRPGGGYSHSRANAYDIAGYGGSNGSANGIVSILATHNSYVAGYRDGVPDNTGSGYGNFVCLVSRNGDGRLFYTLYGHMQNGTIPASVKSSYSCAVNPASCVPGQALIGAGSVIGKIDHTGFSTNTHLHYEYRKAGTSIGGFSLPPGCVR